MIATRLHYIHILVNFETTQPERAPCVEVPDDSDLTGAATWTEVGHHTMLPPQLDDRHSMTNCVIDGECLFFCPPIWAQSRPSILYLRWLMR